MICANSPGPMGFRGWKLTPPPPIQSPPPQMYRTPTPRRPEISTLIYSRGVYVWGRFIVWLAASCWAAHSPPPGECGEHVGGVDAGSSDRDPSVARWAERRVSAGLKARGPAGSVLRRPGAHQIERAPYRRPSTKGECHSSLKLRLGPESVGLRGTRPWGQLKVMQTSHTTHKTKETRPLSPRKCIGITDEGGGQVTRSETQ